MKNVDLKWRTKENWGALGHRNRKCVPANWTGGFSGKFPFLWKKKLENFKENNLSGDGKTSKARDPV